MFSIQVLENIVLGSHLISGLNCKKPMFCCKCDVEEKNSKLSVAQLNPNASTTEVGRTKMVNGKELGVVNPDLALLNL